MAEDANKILVNSEANTATVGSVVQLTSTPSVQVPPPSVTVTAPVEPVVPEYDGKEPDLVDTKKEVELRESSLKGESTTSFRIVQQNDGNWVGTKVVKGETVAKVRDYDPQIVLQMLLTHP